MVLTTIWSAAATLNGVAILTPTTSTNFQGSTATCRAEVNATGILTTGWNVTFRASTDSSYSNALCTDTVIANTTDTASCTCDTTTLTAGKNNFVAIAQNGTNQINSTATSIVVDNTAPNIVNVLPLGKPQFLHAITVECDSSDAIYNTSLAASRYVINWTLPDGTNLTANGVKSNEFGAEAFSMVGTYTLTCDVKDSGNNTARDTKYLSVNTKDNAVAIKDGGMTTQGGGAGNAKIIILFVGSIVVIGGVGIIIAVMSANKKKRGR